MTKFLTFLSLLVVAQATASEHRVEKDIEFASVDGHSLKLDLYLPAKTKNPPLVIWIHGGGWKGGNKSRCPVTFLCDEGYAIASISYRLTDKAIFPAQIHDCKAAVRWLRANAETYGYQTEKIAVAGSSAGGHLAALLGTTGGVVELEGDVGGNLDHSSRVQAIIDYYGPTDFILRAKTHPARTTAVGSSVYLLLGDAADKIPDLARLASPAYHVTDDDPPLLIFQGDKDKTVLPDQSQKIHEVYTAAKLPVTLHLLKGAAHGGNDFYTGENRAHTVAFLKSFIQGAGAPPPRP